MPADFILTGCHNANYYGIPCGSGYPLYPRRKAPGDAAPIPNANASVKMGIRIK